MDAQNIHKKPIRLHWNPRAKLNTRLDQRGAATAEYVITILAAVSFAGLLVVIMRSDEVRSMLTDAVRDALQFGG
ncbi:MAG: DUF4244 domain-containing protein [Microbacteriaceae bacterium]|nr:DUF4244 domain-containing protein [Microbacteriaceae bacterium]